MVCTYDTFFFWHIFPLPLIFNFKVKWDTVKWHLILQCFLPKYTLFPMIFIWFSVCANMYYLIKLYFALLSNFSQDEIYGLFHQIKMFSISNGNNLGKYILFISCSYFTNFPIMLVVIKSFLQSLTSKNLCDIIKLKGWFAKHHWTRKLLPSNYHGYLFSLLD